VNKKAKKLIFCMIFVAGGVFAQKKISIYGVDFLDNKQKWPHESYFPPQIKYPSLPGEYKIKGKAFSETGSPDVNNKPERQTQNFFRIEPDFYYKNMGFFCKKELQLEKATKIPFKFRLGSVAQCDWLEGKPNTVLRH
jgi:hypothetical protein